HPHVAAQIVLGRHPAPLRVRQILLDALEVGAQAHDLRAVLRVLASQRPQAIEAVIADESYPDRPPHEDQPGPAQVAPEAVLGYGVAGEAVAAKARPDIAHDVPVLSCDPRPSGARQAPRP